MDVIEIFENPCVRMLEEDIVSVYEFPSSLSIADIKRAYKTHEALDFHPSDTHRQKEEFDIIRHLLDERYRLLRRLQVYDDDMKSLLNAFNDRLRSAATTLYNRVKLISEEYYSRNDGFGEYEVEGKLFLGYSYPESHPIQSDTAHTIWEILTQGGYYPLYDDGCTWSLRVSERHPLEKIYKMEEWLGFSDGVDNWNEGLDGEWSKDMHLVYPIHNLYDHLGFSLYDLIYVDKFNIEVNVKFDDEIHYNS